MKRLILCLFSVAVMVKANERNLDEIFRDGSNKFEAKMFAEIVKKNPGKSVVLSAFSVMPPLAQLALASVGESHDELLASIGMPNDNVTKAVFSKVNTNLKSSSGITLNMASKIYVGEDYEINSDFAVLTRGVFGSEVENIDFTQNEEAASEVNRWVENQTNHRIKDLVDPSSLEKTVALLVNTIYFKAEFENPFDKYATIDRDFHINKDNVVQIPTMSNTDRYDYIDSPELDAQVLKIRYTGGDSALYVAVPHDIEGIEKLEEKLKDLSLLDNVISKMYDSEVEVYLPKFKIETETDLKEVLQNINVKRLFDSQEARLDNLLECSGDVYISGAKQKAFIDVNEAGTEAAAANVFNAVGNSFIVDAPPTPLFVADRPFIFVVKDKSLTLFSGVFAGN